MTHDPPRPLTRIEKLAIEIARYAVNSSGEARVSWMIVRDLREALDKAGINWRSVDK
jgi:hypothetical protein